MSAGRAPGFRGGKIPPGRVPGLNDTWAEHQLELDGLPGMWEPADYLGGAPDLVRGPAVDGDGLPLEPVCGSCHLVDPGTGMWECDPERPGCPLHDVPEQTRDHGLCASEGGPYAACHWTCQGTCTPGGTLSSVPERTRARPE